jgi:NIPSNAP
VGGPVFELRQYTLHPGTRETLVRLFDEHFVEGQEDHGIQVIGQFRDLGRPDRFVWIRGFDTMEARTTALAGFYNSALWKTHAPQANATMIDFSDVLLLRPAGPGSSFEHDPEGRPRRSDPERRGEGGFVVATVHSFARPVEEGFCARFRAEVAPALAVTGTPLLAELVTESAPNSYPPLPVREGEHVFVWLAAYPDRATERASARMLSRILPGLRAFTRSEPERLLLAPTRRSALRYRPLEVEIRRKA